MRYILAVVNGPTWEWEPDKMFNTSEEMWEYINSQDKYRGWTSLCVTILPN